MCLAGCIGNRQLLRMLDLLHEQVKAAPPTPAVDILPPLHPRTATAQTLPISRTTSLLSHADQPSTAIAMRKLSDLTPAHLALPQPAVHPAVVLPYPASAPTSPAAKHATPMAATTAAGNAAATAAWEQRIAELEGSLATLRQQGESERATHQQQLSRLAQQHEAQLHTTATHQRATTRQYEHEIAELAARIESADSDQRRQLLADQAERDERVAELARLRDEVAVLKGREAEWMGERGGRDEVLKGMVEERERKIGETIRYYDGRMQRWKEMVQAIKEEMKGKVEKTHAMMAQLKTQLAQEKEHIADVTQQMTAQQHSNKLRIEELEKDLQRLREERDDAVQKLQQAREQREHEVSALHAQVAELQETIAALQAQWHAREAEVAAVMQQWQHRWEAREHAAAHDVYLLAFDKDEVEAAAAERRAQDERARERLARRVAVLEGEVMQRTAAFAAWCEGLGEGRAEVARLRREREVEERRRREVEGERYGLERELQLRREEAVRVGGLEKEVVRLGLRVQEGEMGGGNVGMVVGVVMLCQLMAGALYVYGGDLLSDRLSSGLQGWL